MNLIDQAKNLANNAQQPEAIGALSFEELLSTLDILNSVEVVLTKAINARSLMRRLPSELLLRIFSSIPLDMPRGVGFSSGDVPISYKIRNPRPLLRIAAVCRQWRALILDSPSLWSSVSCADPREGVFGLNSGAPLHIYISQRSLSGEGPLYVCADAPTPQEYPCDEFFHQYGHRVEELHVILNASAIATSGSYDTLPASLVFAAPSLERLSLRMLGPTLPPFSRRTATLFNNTGSHLTSLSLVDVPFLPGSTIGAKLTCLILETSWTHTYYKSWGPLAYDILLLLSGTPLLREAYICGIADTPVKELEPPPQMVSLTRLQKLRLDPLTPSGSQAEVVLSRLHLQDSCLVRLAHTVRTRGRAEALLELLGRYRWEQTKVQCVWEGGWNGMPHRIQVSLQVVNTYGGGICIDLAGFEGEGTIAAVETALRSILSSPPFAAAEDVWLSGTSSYLFLRNVLPLGGKRTLHLLNCPTFDESYVPQLWPPRTPPRSHSVILNHSLSLETLHVCIRDKTQLDGLVSLLQARTWAECPITRLAISFNNSGGDPNAAVQAASIIRASVQAYVQSIEIGEDLYRHYGWPRILPPRCISPDEIHRYWAPWTGGIIGM